MYDEVDWGLLVFFVGLFIIVGGGGTRRADGAPAPAGRDVEPASTPDLRRRSPPALSNIVSNVPAVMLLRTLVAGFPDPHDGWLALAMASTLAGNLTITGSVANIIVVERAAAEGVHVGFREYFRVGLPVTLVILLVGTIWLLVSLYLLGP